MTQVSICESIDHPFLPVPKHLKVWQALGEFKFHAGIFDHSGQMVLVVSREYYNDRVGCMPHPVSREDINTPPVSTNILAWAKQVEPDVVIADAVFARAALGREENAEDAAFQRLQAEHEIGRA